jgi:hypothetical protein
MNKESRVNPDRYQGLSARAANILNNANIDTPEGVRAAYKAGRIKYPLYGYSGWRGLGKVTFRELAVWAGIELPKITKKVRRCPHCNKVL